MMSAAATETLGTCVLAALGLSVIAFLAFRFRHFPLTWHQRFWWGVNLVLSRVLWRARVSGPLPVAPGQGAIVICNHRSPVDPCLIELGTHRVIHWLIAKEYCSDWRLSWFLRMAEVIPTNRAGMDTAATKMAIRYAQNGELVGLFPEGRLNTTDNFMLSGRPGVALIALKARVPIIPCYAKDCPYDGTTLGALLMHARVKVIVGRPVDVSEYCGREKERGVLEKLTRRLMHEVARLGGHPEFEPELAGRFYKPE
jgi:1-acyl-sn-glycerol-3-phosphate acyltransferase